MTLSIKNPLVQYYNWMYNELPNDICSFFWGTILSVIFFVLYIPGRLLPIKPMEKLIVLKGIIFWFLATFLTMIGWSVTIEAMNNLFFLMDIWKYFLIGLGIMAGAIGVFLLAFSIAFGTVYGIYYTYNVVKGARPTTVMRDTWNAIRGKYCTKIYYK